MITLTLTLTLTLNKGAHDAGGISFQCYRDRLCLRIRIRVVGVLKTKPGFKWYPLLHPSLPAIRSESCALHSFVISFIHPHKQQWYNVSFNQISLIIICLLWMLICMTKTQCTIWWIKSTLTLNFDFWLESPPQPVQWHITAGCNCAAQTVFNCPDWCAEL
jgi:hypothetical protein